MEDPLEEEFKDNKGR